MKTVKQKSKYILIYNDKIIPKCKNPLSPKVLVRTISTKILSKTAVYPEVLVRTISPKKLSRIVSSEVLSEEVSSEVLSEVLLEEVLSQEPVSLKVLSEPVSKTLISKPISSEVLSEVLSKTLIPNKKLLLIKQKSHKLLLKKVSYKPKKKSKISIIYYNDNINSDIIKKYIKYGWTELSDIFLYNKNAKIRDILNNDNDISDILKKINKVRKYIIKEYFNYFNNNKKTKYISNGSNNITSDYDISIIGINAPELKYKIFFKFLSLYNNTLSYLFDTNIYSIVPYYLNYKINTNIINNIKYLKYNKYFRIVPYTSQDYNISIEFALIKILKTIDSDIIINNTEYLYIINNYLKRSIILFNKINNEYLYKLNIIKKNYKYFKYNNNILDLITKHKLNYKYSIQLYNIIYKNKDIKTINIIDLFCHAAYFSIEGYYTPSTLSVIVLELQSKITRLNLSDIDYICSTIENLGDFRFHILKEIKENNNINNIDEWNKYILLKYSKYIYRIYYLLGNALKKKNNNNIFFIKSKKILKKIIKYRGKNINGCNIKFDLLDYYDNIKTIYNYVELFTYNILYYINVVLIFNNIKKQ